MSQPTPPVSLRLISGGRPPRRSADPVVDRLLYAVPRAVPEQCPSCGGAVRAVAYPWGPAWSCADAACQRGAQPKLVEVDHLQSLLALSPDWTCPCCAGGLQIRFDQPVLLPTCAAGTTTDWAQLSDRIRG